MKTLLLSLLGIFCTATLQSAATDPAVPLQTETGKEVHAAVTDMPDIIDMSHADPKTWHALPSAAQVYEQSPADLGFEELEFLDPTHPSVLDLTVHSRFES